MVNLYSLTRIDRYTRGATNQSLQHRQRNPKYYEYARGVEQAIEKAEKHYNCEDVFECHLEKKNVEPPFPEEVQG